MSRHVRTCLSCGAHRVAPIVYGEPKLATMRGAALDVLVACGCMVDGAFSRRSCVVCGHR